MPHTCTHVRVLTHTHTICKKLRCIFGKGGQPVQPHRIHSESGQRKRLSHLLFMYGMIRVAEGCMCKACEEKLSSLCCKREKFTKDYQDTMPVLNSYLSSSGSSAKIGGKSAAGTPSLTAGTGHIKYLRIILWLSG